MAATWLNISSASSNKADPLSAYQIELRRVAQERERYAELAQLNVASWAATDIVRHGKFAGNHQRDNRAGRAEPRDFHFELHFVNDELEDGVLALDEEQVWIEPDWQRVIISLTGAQLQQLAACPSARARTTP
jgi:hypothetical protein